MESFEAFIRRIQELLDRVDELDEDIREDVYELLEGIDVLHRRALESLVGVLDGKALARVMEDDAAAWLLEAYGVKAVPETKSVPVEIKRRP